MKSILLLLVSLIVMNLINSCQKEENTIIQEPTQNIKMSSPISKFLERVTQNNTSIDNVMDGTSVFRVKLPVNITLNSTNLTVNSINDYQLVVDLKNASGTDDDIVNYSFPITVSMRNFEEIIINNLNQLNVLISQNNDLSDISCLSIVYPITLNKYDSSNQVADVLTLNSNSQFINFLFNLNESIFYSINYPISIINPANETVIINSNEILKDNIESAISQCGSNSGSTDDFISIITSGSWRVSYYFDDEDETSVYVGYVFTFNANNTIQIVKNGNNFSGTWSFYEDDGINKFDIQFEDSVLNQLTEDWELFEFSNILIQLKDDGNDEYLNFSKL